MLLVIILCFVFGCVRTTIASYMIVSPQSFNKYHIAKDTDNVFCKDCSNYLWIKDGYPLFLTNKHKCLNEKIIIN